VEDSRLQDAGLSRNNVLNQATDAGAGEAESNDTCVRNADETGNDNTTAPNIDGVGSDNDFVKQPGGRSDKGASAPEIELQYDALEVVEIADSRVLFKCPQNDDIIPKTSDERRRRVKELIKAMKNNVNTIERPTIKIYINRWQDGASYYREVLFERQAWRLLGDMLDLHNHGWTYSIEDPKLRGDI